jgi:putative phosphoesterase
MRVGILSDTHASRIEQLPRQLIDVLREMDLIVHLGDYTGKGLLDDLRRLGDFRGVYGNMDPEAIREELPEEDVLELGRHKLGLTHEGGTPWGMRRRNSDCFKGVDVVLYGHTHIAKNESRDGVLYFNPGSAVGKFPALRKTYGIITIESSVKGEIIEID